MVTLMNLLNDNTTKEKSYIEPHPTATMVDDRYAITTEESEKIAKRYFTEEGYLKELPAKEKT